MAHVHLVLQGKGGVGKTFVATLLGQYLAGHGGVECVDTDPVNATLAGFKGLCATRLDLLEDDAIQPRRFDALIDRAEQSKAEHLVIDNGASSFVALAQYLVENDVATLLREMGHRLTLHAVVTGGQGFADTAENLRVMVGNFSSLTEFCVWLNPYFGKVEMRGKRFEEMKVYEQCRDRIRALVYLPAWPKDTTGRDMSEMLGERLSFAEALADSGRSIVVRQRLKLARQALFERLDVAVLV